MELDPRLPPSHARPTEPFEEKTEGEGKKGAGSPKPVIAENLSTGEGTIKLALLATLLKSVGHLIAGQNQGKLTDSLRQALNRVLFAGNSNHASSPAYGALLELSKGLTSQQGAQKLGETLETWLRSLGPSMAFGKPGAGGGEFKSIADSVAWLKPFVDLLERSTASRTIEAKVWDKVFRQMLESPFQPLRASANATPYFPPSRDEGAQAPPLPVRVEAFLGNARNAEPDAKGESVYRVRGMDGNTARIRTSETWREGSFLSLRLLGDSAGGAQRGASVPEVSPFSLMASSQWEEAGLSRVLGSTEREAFIKDWSTVLKSSLQNFQHAAPAPSQRLDLLLSLMLARGVGPAAKAAPDWISAMTAGTPVLELLQSVQPANAEAASRLGMETTLLAAENHEKLRPPLLPRTETFSAQAWLHWLDQDGGEEDGNYRQWARETLRAVLTQVEARPQDREGQPQVQFFWHQGEWKRVEWKSRGHKKEARQERGQAGPEPTKLSLRLSTLRMGSVEVDLGIKEKQLDLRLKSRRGSSRELMAHHIGWLRDTLDVMGYTLRDWAHLPWTQEGENAFSSPNRKLSADARLDLLG